MNMKELLNAVRWAKNNPGALMKAMGDGAESSGKTSSGEAENEQKSEQGKETQNVDRTV